MYAIAAGLQLPCTHESPRTTAPAVTILNVRWSLSTLRKLLFLLLNSTQDCNDPPNSTDTDYAPSLPT
jgi:hypothetical protein